MRAMMLTRDGLGCVEPREIDKPVPGPSDVLVKVLAPVLNYSSDPRCH